MRGSSIRHFQRLFPGSFNTRFGDIALNRASIFATAIRSMIAADAQICGAASTADAIGLPYVRRPKMTEIAAFIELLDFYFRLCIIHLQL